MHCRNQLGRNTSTPHAILHTQTANFLSPSSTQIIGCSWINTPPRTCCIACDTRAFQRDVMLTHWTSILSRMAHGTHSCQIKHWLTFSSQVHLVTAHLVCPSIHTWQSGDDNNSSPFCCSLMPYSALYLTTCCLCMHIGIIMSFYF